MNSFTEQDLQDYFEGTFAGDSKALVKFFTSDNQRKAVFDSYRLVFEVIGETKSEFAFAALVEKLASSIQEQTEKKYRKQELWMTRSLMLLVVAGCMYSFSLILRAGFASAGIKTNYLIVAGLGVFAFLIFSYSAEARKLKMKYNL